jgi:crotonobetainyl-CoA:carnitine CoA-transferase CaiB-like acyl-CoA transferase
MHADERTNTGSAGPLSGVRILDLTSVFLGPYSTLLLGDMGADVIKVEAPKGDVVRTVGPSRHQGMSAIFLNANRSKRSIVIDLAQPRGRDVLLKLARGADAFIHSMRPQAIAKLGLTYDAVSAVRPEIVYCSAAGFGREGRYSGRPAYDDVIQGATGFAAAQAHFAGEPQYVAGAIADKTVGLAMVAALLAALYHRERTGEGQEVEVPMFETMTSFFLLEHLYGEVFSPPLGDPVYPRVTSPSRKPYRTLDGHLCVVVYNDKQWSRFFELVGRSELLEDERFSSIAARTQNIDALYEILAAEMSTRTTADWLETLERAEIPAHPLGNAASLLEDPHLRDVDFFSFVEHPSEGTIRSMAFPYAFFGSPVDVERPAPRLGEHTSEVLSEGGFGESEIEELVGDGVVALEHEPQPTA